MSFTKLFSSITESTVWSESSDVRIVWITMLAMADPFGHVFASIPGLAARARVPIEVAEQAVRKFMAPDKYSRTRDYDGRRIGEIEGGWELLTYAKHRDQIHEDGRKTYQREWARERRAAKNLSTPVDKHVDKLSTNCRQVSTSTAVDTEAEEDIEEEEDKNKAVVVPNSSGQKSQKPFFSPGKTGNPQDETPTDLHPLNYAAKILDVLRFPRTSDNLHVVAASVQAEILGGKTPPAAYEFVLAGTQDAIEEGFEINRFFFTNSKYRTEYRQAHGNYKSRTRRRNEDVAERIERLFREDSPAEDLPAGPQKRPLR